MRKRGSETVMGQDISPDRIFWIGRLSNHPEALIGVVDNGNDLVGYGSNGPIFAKEIQSIIGVKAALEVESQMKVQ